MGEKIRDYKYDNLKALLITLVVLGHLLYPFVKTNAAVRLLYIFIYSFHIPAFIYITGKFSKPNLKRIGLFFGLYIGFQLLYIPFLHIFSPDTLASWSLLTPVWLMWYLFSLAIYWIILPFIPVAPSKRTKIIWLTAAFIAAILSGFVPVIGDALALSRTIVFFSFFLMGKWGLLEIEEETIKESNQPKKRKGKGFLLGTLATGLTLGYFMLTGGRYGILWERDPYQLVHIDWFLRMFAILLAVFWIKFLMIMVPNKKIKIISDMGKYTLFTYLIHGFIVKVVLFFCKDAVEINPIMYSVLLTVVIAILLYLGGKGWGVIWKKLKNTTRKKKI